ncbi:ovarian-specific serine/threonine-protein kinase Lok-like isoform X2 [Agrilus planipennis]|uniref:Ovarian-specific serine/threonine-protein kinase Lok-like isoform X2 n=1 Tax=Agrilus planipennis TaxID=224129 RepID=A0A7F5R7F1_AGRPL|nr:ovarian-specific serine/threonine-protein kinase Lok-like isoform X2 [Agrilus planipennis]
MSQLPATLTPTSSAEEKISQGITAEVPWGCLIPNRLGLQKVDLYDEEITFGRSLDCTVRAQEKFITKGRISYISMLHFIVNIKANRFPVIRDVSRNGTWVNGILVGKEKEVILQDGDKISVGMKNYTIFLFKQMIQQKDVPDEVLKKFVILETLGHGAFGKVNLAFLKRGCRPRAIKKLVKGKVSSNKNDTRKIKNEIKILSSLSHFFLTQPNIVSMMEFFENDEAFFIVLEYMDGGTLHDRILRRDCMSEKEAKLIFYQIIRAVKYLHDNEITHRDLKPANILLNSDNVETVVKVSDFGLSKVTENDTLLLTACGTPHFVAPEVWVYQYRGIPYTKKVDIWSTGVILYYMLSTKLPFVPEQSDNLQMLRNLIIRGKYSTNGPIWETISNDGKSILEKMLTVSPNSRADAEQIEKHSWLHNDVEMKEKVVALISDQELDGSIEQPCKRTLDDSIEQPYKRTRRIV